MRVLLSVFVLLAIVAVLVFDGLSMYGAQREAVDFSAKAAQQAAQTYVDTKGNEDAVHRTIQDLATTEGVELLEMTYHKGTTRWYEVTIQAESDSILLKYIPYVKDHLSQRSTTIEHF
jgi:type II secretory pathway pseudopilin PulG